jgi:hypothetical protein
MTADEFRAGLVELGFAGPDAPTGQTAFAAWLTLLGHPAEHIARNVRRWAHSGPPGEIDVIFALIRQRPSQRRSGLPHSEPA